MKYAININSVLPVRLEASESSEMISQLLFGEQCRIIDFKDSFFKIENEFDKYIGWVDKKGLLIIDQNKYKDLKASPVFCTCVPLADAFCLTDKTIYKLTAGSIIPFYDPTNSTFIIGDKKFQIHSSFVSLLSDSIKENIIPYTRLFENTPYLWGGKNILGIDCSGLVQLAYFLSGYRLTRDTSTQINEGIEINSLDKAEATDLIFFEKNKKVVHVGIYLGNNKIIHASGKVRIDAVDNVGIYNSDLEEYTHHILTIRRIC